VSRVGDGRSREEGGSSIPQREKGITNIRAGKKLDFSGG